MSTLDYPQLRLDTQALCFPLYATTRAVTRKYAELLAGTGLTYPQYLVMLVLWEDAPTTVSALGSRLQLDSGTLTPLLKRLEAAGFVSRDRDPADERRVLVSPTQAGWDLRERVADVPARLGASLGVTREDVVELRTRLDAILASLADS